MVGLADADVRQLAEIRGQAQVDDRRLEIQRHALVALERRQLQLQRIDRQMCVGSEISLERLDLERLDVVDVLELDRRAALELQRDRYAAFEFQRERRASFEIRLGVVESAALNIVGNLGIRHRILRRVVAAERTYLRLPAFETESQTQSVAPATRRESRI